MNWNDAPFGSQWPSAANSEFQNFGDRTLLTQAAETAHRPTPSEWDDFGKYETAEAAPGWDFSFDTGYQQPLNPKVQALISAFEEQQERDKHLLHSRPVKSAHSITWPKEGAAVAIQAKVRSRQAQYRCRIRHSGLLIIQALFRGWIVRSKVEQCWAASLVMQASIRCWQARRARSAASLIIQVSVRSWKTRINTDTHVEGDVVGLELPQRLHPAAGADIAQDHGDQDRLHPAAESAAPNVPHAPVYARDSRSVGGHHGVAGSVVGKPGGSGESGHTPATHPAPLSRER